MYKLFAKYVSVGVVNTAIHWCVFFVLLATGTTQAIANMFAFIVAVTFSFFANARFTFNGRATGGRYLIYITFMAGMAAGAGQIGDVLQLPYILTLVLFSSISLVMGFFYSKYIVFRERK